MHIKSLALLVLALPALASEADDSIAELTRIDGHVLLRFGNSMASATHPVRLSPGVRVLATPGSSAEITFDDGCRVEVGPGARYEVDRQSPCIAPLTMRSEPGPRKADR
jgi:hypothetical protein